MRDQLDLIHASCCDGEAMCTNATLNAGSPGCKCAVEMFNSRCVSHVNYYAVAGNLGDFPTFEDDFRFDPTRPQSGGVLKAVQSDDPRNLRPATCDCLTAGDVYGTDPTLDLCRSPLYGTDPTNEQVSTAPVDCSGVKNGGAVVDVCGECGGDNSTCADAVCQTPTHGRVRYMHVNDKSNAIHFPSVATYECEDGYTAQFAPRHCQLDGSWSGSEGSCAESFCEMLPPPDNGEVFHSHHRAFHSSVTFTCDDGYKLEPLAEIEGSIACGDTVSGSTVGARSVHGEAAGEHIYHFAILDTANTMYFESCQSTLETVLRVTSLDLEHEFVVGENGTASAADCQNSYVEFSNLPSGEYALTIEGEGTAEGQYSVFMNCSSSHKHCHAACGRCYELVRQCPYDPDLVSCDHPDLNVGDHRIYHG